jgi:hypothetical protein
MKLKCLFRLHQWHNGWDDSSIRRCGPVSGAARSGASRSPTAVHETGAYHPRWAAMVVVTSAVVATAACEVGWGQPRHAPQYRSPPKPPVHTNQRRRGQYLPLSTASSRPAEQAHLRQVPVRPLTIPAPLRTQKGSRSFEPALWADRLPRPDSQADFAADVPPEAATAARRGLVSDP